MEHFDIILALSRMALNGDEDRVARQIGRLRTALQQSDAKQAEKLHKLLARQKRRQDVAPMALEQMRARRTGLQLPGEALSRSTPLPTDRESGAPLVRLLFPDDRDDLAPILEPELEAAIADQLREWDRVEELARMGVKPNMRCLLYGAPGVGKTLLARFIGHQLRLPIVEARLDGLVASFLGTTGRNIGALFDFADRYRCILFLDEFDGHRQGTRRQPGGRRDQARCQHAAPMSRCAKRSGIHACRHKPRTPAGFSRLAKIRGPHPDPPNPSPAHELPCSSAFLRPFASPIAKCACWFGSRKA